MNRCIDGLSTATPLLSFLTSSATTDFTNSNTFLPQNDIVNAACLCFGSVSTVPLVSSSSSERKSSSTREGGANLAVPIGTTTSCKCRRKRLLVFYTLSCELVGRLSNLKNCLPRICRGVEGVVGEVKSVSWGGARTKGEVHKRELTNKMFLHSNLLTSLTSSLTLLFLRLENSHCELMR